jgi:hypothetical protein
MRLFGAVAVVVTAAVFAACGGSDGESVAEPAQADNDANQTDVVRAAGDDVQVIMGCRIEPKTQCPGVDFYATLRGPNLAGANLKGANLVGAVFDSTNLRGANLAGANLENARFWYADLRDADLTGANLTGADLFTTNMRGTDLMAARLVGAGLSKAHLDGADLSRADLSGVNTISTLFCNTTMPDGTINDRNC